MGAKRKVPASEAKLTRDIVVIGSSTGGVEALSALCGRLPERFPASVFVVQHVSAYHTSYLPEILSREGPLPATHAVQGEVFRRGHIYVAPPDKHLLLEEKKIRLSSGPRENGHRPAANALFRSAAYHHGARVIGIVLSGALDCGANGLRQVKLSGGLALIQSPEDAAAPDMPINAAKAITPDYQAPAADLGKLLAKLVIQKVAQVTPTDRSRLRRALKAYVLDSDRIRNPQGDGKLSGYSCPECGGVLYDLLEVNGEFRCRTGHAYTADSLEQEHDFIVESALYTALRALEDRAQLIRRMTQRALGGGQKVRAQKLQVDSQAAEVQAEALRRLLLTRK